MYVITAIGILIPTEVKVSKTYCMAKNIMSNMFNEYDLNKNECKEISMDCWKGYSKNSGCEVEIQLHYIEEFDN